MIYQQLGPSGLTVSAVGLGCNNFGARMADEDVPSVVGAAIDAGITLFDTADVYGNAGRLGDAARQGARRVAATRWSIATKFGMDMGGANGPDWGVRGSRRYIRLAVEAACVASAPTGSTSTSCTAPTRTRRSRRPSPRSTSWCRGQGPLHRLLELRRLAGGRRRLDRPRSGGYEPFVSAQNEYSLAQPRRSRPSSCRRCEHTGQGLLPFFPLARGLLTGKYRRGATAPDGSRLAGAGRACSPPRTSTRSRRLQAFADERGLTLLQIAIGGLAAMPTVGSVIAGATKVSQIEANVAAGSWQPTADDLQTLMDLTA